MTRCGHRGDGAWPDLRAVTMKSLRETQAGETGVTGGPGADPRWRTGRLSQGAPWAQAWLEAGQERKRESEDRPGDQRQRGLEEGQRARGEVGLEKTVQNGSGSHLGTTAATRAHVTLTYPPSQKYVFAELYREKEHEGTCANSTPNKAQSALRRKQYVWDSAQVVNSF